MYRNGEIPSKEQPEIDDSNLLRQQALEKLLPWPLLQPSWQTIINQIFKTK
jgi:hypothetical protein